MKTWLRKIKELFILCVYAVWTWLCRIFQQLIDELFGLRPIVRTFSKSVTKLASFMRVSKLFVASSLLLLLSGCGSVGVIQLVNYQRQQLLFRQEEYYDTCQDDLEYALKKRELPEDTGDYLQNISVSNFLFRMAYDVHIKKLNDECGSVKSYKHSTIAEAAVAYAWLTHEDSRCNDGTELYQAVHDGVRSDFDTWYQSCDRGVTTAIMWSGADDNIPRGDCRILITYFYCHSDKWRCVGSLDLVGRVNLEPGDILICDEHVLMYVGHDLIKRKYPNAPDDYDTVSASIGDQVTSGGPGKGITSRSPACGHDLVGTNLDDYMVFRYIGDYSGQGKYLYVGDVSDRA